MCITFNSVNMFESKLFGVHCFLQVKMLATPAKFHYVFNLRDLSRIWQGMLRIAERECPDVATVLNLWNNECTRVIADR